MHIMYNSQAPGPLNGDRPHSGAPVFVQKKPKSAGIVQRFLPYPSFFDKTAYLCISPVIFPEDGV